MGWVTRIENNRFFNGISKLSNFNNLCSDFSWPIYDLYYALSTTNQNSTKFLTHTVQNPFSAMTSVSTRPVVSRGFLNKRTEVNSLDWLFSGTLWCFRAQAQIMQIKVQISALPRTWAHCISKPELPSLQTEGNGSGDPGGLWWGFNEGYKWSAHRLPATWEVDACPKPMLSWAELLEQEAKKGHVSCG